jgi:hypothetical protein
MCVYEDGDLYPQSIISPTWPSHCDLVAIIDMDHLGSEIAYICLFATDVYLCEKHSNIWASNGSRVMRLELKTDFPTIHEDRQPPTYTASSHTISATTSKKKSEAFVMIDTSYASVCSLRAKRVFTWKSLSLRRERRVFLHVFVYVPS